MSFHVPSADAPDSDKAACLRELLRWLDEQLTILRLSGGAGPGCPYRDAVDYAYRYLADRGILGYPPKPHIPEWREYPDWQKRADAALVALQSWAQHELAKIDSTEAQVATATPPKAGGASLFDLPEGQQSPSDPKLLLRAADRCVDARKKLRDSDFSADMAGSFARELRYVASELNLASSFEEGLSAMDRPEVSEPLQDYRWYHSARADLLRRLGRPEEAYAAYSRALDLTANSSEARFLAKRLAEVS